MGFWPLNVIAVLIGVLLVISGIFNLVRVFDRSEPHRVWLGIAGCRRAVRGSRFRSRSPRRSAGPVSVADVRDLRRCAAIRPGTQPPRRT